MFRTRRTRATSSELAEALSRLATSDEAGTDGVEQRERLEDGAGSFAHPPSGQLPRSVLAELHAEEDEAYRRYAEEVKLQRLAQFIAALKKREKKR